MTIISQLELPGSPREQASWASGTWYWDPTAELASGETISAPTCAVYKYDPAYAANVADAQNVSSMILAAGSPSVGTGTHAGMVQIVVQANSLTPGYEYRFQLACVGSLGSTPARYFRLRCRV